MHLGNVLLAQGDLVGAEQVFHSRGLTETALQFVELARQLDPCNADLYLEAASWYWELGDGELACQMTAQGLALEPGHPGLLELQGRCTQ